jgi:hypothetical protein
MRRPKPVSPFEWVRTEQAGCYRSFLFICGVRSPYFVDEAVHIECRSYGERVGLWGAGMGREVRVDETRSYRIAGCLGTFDTVKLAKKQAEHCAEQAGLIPAAERISRAVTLAAPSP